MSSGKVKWTTNSMIGEWVDPQHRLSTKADSGTQSWRWWWSRRQRRDMSSGRRQDEAAGSESKQRSARIQGGPRYAAVRRSSGDPRWLNTAGWGCPCRYRQVHPASRWPTGSVSRSRSNGIGLSPDLGHLFRGLRWCQDRLRFASASGQGAGSSVSRSTSQRLSTCRARAPVVSPHPLRHDGWRSQHHLYESALGHQNTLHGTAIAFPLLGGV